MPSPKFLTGIPKPLLFGLYGAVGGFVGALVIAEPLYQAIHLLDDEARNLRRVALMFVGVGVWTAGVAAPLCLALLAGQHHYLRGSLPGFDRIAIGLIGGTVAGVVGGSVGQFCFCFAPGNFLLNCLVRMFAWALFGGLVGWGLSFFIPNMRRPLGFAGGFTGGVVGCVLFLFVSLLSGTIGRVLGGLVIGFCIGAMVVLAETAFRRAWLEVRYGEREVVTVTLGPEPVKIGSDAKACTVWARGAAAVALRFFVRDGEVICDDRETRDESVADDGFAREVGNVTVTVRTSDRAATAPARGSRRPVARPVSQDDDDKSGPPPVAASSPATLPSSIAPKSAALPMKPAIKATTKDPNACPSCNRAIPGQPGARYCMVCDRTF